MASDSVGNIAFDMIGLGKVLARGRLAVPLNQREYAWEDKQVLDLFQDLHGAIDGNKKTYFLGTIVLTEGSNGIPEIADGQQRLATTTILLAAIRDYMVANNEPMLVRSIEEEFLFRIDRGIKDITPRLTLNFDDRKYFTAHVLQPPGTPERQAARATRESHRRILRATELAKNRVETIVAGHSSANRLVRLDAWVTFIEDNARVILLTVPNDQNAFVMFQTLNDRGLKTTQADLVKNYLFQESGTAITEALHHWSSMGGTLEGLDDDDSILTYLRHLLITLHGPTREREILARIESTYRGRPGALSILSTMNDAVSDYVAVAQHEHPKWNNYPAKVREFIRTLSVLRVAQIRPLLFAVSRSFIPVELESAFRFFVSLTVRFLVAGGRGGTLEEAYAIRAHEVMNGKIKTTQELISALEDVIPTDTQFEAAFTSLRVSKNNLARYYLRSLEMTAKGQPDPELIPNEDTVINLEHVLPENPGSAWGNIDRDVAGAYYRRLGNMVLLQAAVNSVLGNAGFDDKKVAYASSAYLLTAEVADYSAWTPDEINQRQERLAGLALLTWQI